MKPRPSKHLTPSQYATRILKSRRTIVINDALMRGLGFETTRDFFTAMGDWGYRADFSRFHADADTHIQIYLRYFIKDQFIN